MGARARGKTTILADPARFGRLIGRQIEGLVTPPRGKRRPATPLAQAVATTRVPRQTLERIVRGEAPRLRGETLRRLGKLWPAGRLPADVLGSVYLATDAIPYMRWVDREIERAKGCDPGEAWALLTFLRHTNLVPELELAQHPTGQNVLQKRWALRMWRSLAPLLPGSWGAEGVERDWQELSMPELRKVVRAGLAIQDIMLRRDDDLARLAQMTAAMTPAERVARMMGYGPKFPYHLRTRRRPGAPHKRKR